jgi:AbrB family looped-hinge helix DNA binding protein
MPSTTVTSKGRVTIPKAIRDRLQVDAGDQIDFVVTEHGDVVVRRAEGMNETNVRQPGRMRGRIRIARCFDAPLPGFS